MYKVFICISIFFFFSGCGQQNSSILPYQNTEEKKSGFLNILTEYGKYPDPKIYIHIGTGTPNLDNKATNEISPKSNEEFKKNGLKTSTITGYLYTYIYKDLGIKITTPANYEPYFSTKTNIPLLKRSKNSIHNVQSKFDYIGFFFKDSKLPLKEEVFDKHLPSGCTLITGIVSTKTTPPFSSMQGWEIIYIASKLGNLASNGEKFDKEFSENTLSIAFVMDPKKPNKYYKISYGDCAPGPCTIFDSIEFF